MQAFLFLRGFSEIIILYHSLLDTHLPAGQNFFKALQGFGNSQGEAFTVIYALKNESFPALSVPSQAHM